MVSNSELFAKQIKEIKKKNPALPMGRLDPDKEEPARCGERWGELGADPTVLPPLAWLGGCWPWTGLPVGE